MSYENTWVNDDGLKVPFGKVSGTNSNAGSVHTVGTKKELRLDVDFSNLPTVGSAVQGDNMGIPAGASIISAVYTPSVTFSHAVEIGTMGADGLEEDKDGLIATSTLATGTIVTGAGAQIGDVTAEDLYITVRPTTTTPTAGAGELVVTYSI